MTSEDAQALIVELLSGGAMPTEVAGRLRARDEADGTKTDLRDEHAASAIMAFFKAHPRELFYERQLAVIFEKLFFHWMTTRVLHQLVARSKLATDLDQLDRDAEEISIRFFRLPTHRYWKGQSKEIKELVALFSKHTFGKAMGKHAEMLFDAGLAKAGFMPIAENVSEYKDRKWGGGRNLDRLYARDGVVWGAEIKNKLRYIDRAEFEEKLEMSRYLGAKPLFINREMPKTYINEVVEQGGYCLVFGYQFYPFGQQAFGERVRTRLHLPIGVEVGTNTINRFLEWHYKHLED